MDQVIDRVVEFATRVYPERRDLYGRLARDGQSPRMLMISCADSRIVPEAVMQAEPGDLFVCRNAGNIVPPFAATTGGVTATVEYAVAVLGVADIVVCGHSDCGAMKGLAGPTEALDGVPSVAAWLRHGAAARAVVDNGYPELSAEARVRAITLENIVAQLAHLRTHPSVAAAIAKGTVTLHGWYVDIHAGEVLALDGDSGQFRPIDTGDDLPVALAAATRLAAAPRFLQAAE